MTTDSLHKQYLDIIDYQVLSNAELIANVKISSDKQISNMPKPITKNIQYGIILNQIKEIEKEFPDYTKELLKKIKYDDNMKILRHGTDYSRKNIKERETRGYKCTLAKKCKKDSSVCFFDKYATVKNVAKDLGEKYDLDETIADSLISLLFFNLMTCSPNFKFVVGKNATNPSGDTNHSLLFQL